MYVRKGWEGKLEYYEILQIKTEVCCEKHIRVLGFRVASYG